MSCILLYVRIPGSVETNRPAAVERIAHTTDGASRSGKMWCQVLRGRGFPKGTFKGWFNAGRPGDWGHGDYGGPGGLPPRAATVLLLSLLAIVAQLACSGGASSVESLQAAVAASLDALRRT